MTSWQMRYDFTWKRTAKVRYDSRHPCLQECLLVTMHIRDYNHDIYIIFLFADEPLPTDWPQPLSS
jgi:hypothetical protein